MTKPTAAKLATAARESVRATDTPPDDLVEFPPEVRAACADLPPLVPTERTLEWSGYSKPGWWKGMAEGRFPRPVKLGPNRVAWLRSDLARWLASRVAVRTAAAEAAAARAGGE